MEEQNALGKSVSLDHFGGLEGHQYMSLSTFRKDGTAVATPVWFVDVDGILQVTTEEHAGKAKRIRNNPQVTVAPCTIRGRVLGAAVEGRARLLPEEEGEVANRNLGSKYGLLYRGFLIVKAIFARNSPSVYIEIVAPNDPAAENDDTSDAVS